MNYLTDIRRICLTLALVAVSVMCADCSQSAKAAVAKEEKVVICTGPNSHKYHATSECRGLNRCSTEFRRVTVEEARKLDYKPCKICYGRSQKK